MFRTPRQHNDAHLRFIRGLRCIICGDNTSTEAAHVRFQCRPAGKRYAGKGEKPDDRWTLPLCGQHHRDQHSMDEEMFWEGVGCDPIFYAMALWGVTGNHALGEQIVHEAQQRSVALASPE
jgi:hypothetical protein